MLKDKVIGQVADTATIEKMRKMLALSNGKSKEGDREIDAATEAQAIAAATKLQDLLMRYGMTEDDLGEYSIDEVHEEHISTLKNIPEAWYSHLLHSVCDACFCKWFKRTSQVWTGKVWRKEYKIIIYGRSTNMKIARNLFAYLQPLAYTLGYQAGAEYKKKYGRAASTAFFASFKQGFAVKLGERMKEKKDEMIRQGLGKTDDSQAFTPEQVMKHVTAEEKVLILKRDALQIRTVAGKEWNIQSQAGYETGQDKGDTVSLHTQLG